MTDIVISILIFCTIAFWALIFAFMAALLLLPDRGHKTPKLPKQSSGLEIGPSRRGVQPRANPKPYPPRPVNKNPKQ